MSHKIHTSFQPLEESIMDFTILGMGKTGHAAACYLMEQGHKVTVWDRNPDKIAALQENGISIYGQIVGEFRPEACQAIGEAVGESRYLLVFTTAIGHRPIAEALKGKLQQGQRILIFNGNWGAVEFAECLGNELEEKEIILGETGAQIFAASLKTTGQSYLKSLKKAVDFSTYPASCAETVSTELLSVFPQLHPVGNVLETSLNMSNPIAHCPLDLFNLAAIDAGQEKLMFASEYTSPRGVAYTEQVDRERLALLEKIGVKGQSLLQLFNKSWQSDYTDLYTAFKKIKSYQTAKSPTDFASRHFTEDIPFGILPIQKLAQRHGVETPYIDAMLDLYRLVLGEEFGRGEPDLTEVDLKKYMG